MNQFLYRIFHWETWHYHIKYIPLLPAWIWYCIKSRSPWFFTSSNPTLTFGGMEGESKEEMYKQIPEGYYPKSIFIKAGHSLADIRTQMLNKDLHFPVVVKPNVGMLGFMFRKINDHETLKNYHQSMPFDYVIQELIIYPLEVSVFYYRLPENENGTISGFLQKEAPYVTGDGKSTLNQLIQKHPELKFKSVEISKRHFYALDIIIPVNEKYILSHACNRSQGGKIISLEHEIDDRLLKVFDDISHYSGNFYYGRYDVKCNSIEELKEGKNFSILEYNGSGSGTQHVYGNGKSLWQACSIILHHWKMLYKISVYNKRRGFEYWNFIKGLKFLIEAKKNLRTLKQLDAQFPVK